MTTIGKIAWEGKDNKETVKNPSEGNVSRKGDWSKSVTGCIEDFRRSKMLMALTQVVSSNCWTKEWVKVKMRYEETSSISLERLSKTL